MADGASGQLGPSALLVRVISGIARGLVLIPHLSLVVLIASGLLTLLHFVLQVVLVSNLELD